MAHPNRTTLWENELGYRLNHQGEGGYQDLYSPSGDIIVSIFDQLGSPYVGLHGLADGLEANGEDYGNAAQACKDIADQHFRLVNPSRGKRLFLTVWRRPQVQWLILVALAIIGIVVTIIT